MAQCRSAKQASRPPVFELREIKQRIYTRKRRHDHCHVGSKQTSPFSSEPTGSGRHSWRQPVTNKVPLTHLFPLTTLSRFLSLSPSPLHLPLLLALVRSSLSPSDLGFSDLLLRFLVSAGWSGPDQDSAVYKLPIDLVFVHSGTVFSFQLLKLGFLYLAIDANYFFLFVVF